MDDIRKLEELKNDLKILSNKKKIEFSELESLYFKLEKEIYELKKLTLEINERQYEQLKVEILSVIGIIFYEFLALNVENSSWFLIAFGLIFIINTIKYIKDLVEYLIKCNSIDNRRYKESEITMKAHLIKKDINLIMSEIDSIDKIIKLDDDTEVKKYIEKYFNYLN